ncbi:ARM repeat-containing protein [Gloeopeniophorella convolvens]|nr:ARM repeat-containing protein [Gloeopeniophorella convolvens]
MLDASHLPASKESRMTQRALLHQRRASKPHTALLNDAKHAWSLARQKNISQEERASYIASLMTTVRGKIQDIVFKHDASRIIQTIVKWGSQQQRDEVAIELKGRFKDLAESKYSKFLVTKLARLCPSHRVAMVAEFRSHVIRLLLHREASQTIADIFDLYANASQRAILVRDFYGREVALFSPSGDGEGGASGMPHGLSGVLNAANADQRKRILVSLKENLDLIFNNSDKGPARHGIVHKALWEYLCEIGQISDEDEREKLYRDIFESCGDLFAEMVHTKDGSKVVREFLARGTAKERKHIIKVIKPYVETMAKDEEAQLVLFTALDVTDDTKLLAKSILSSITQNARSLQEGAVGRRTLLYPLVPRDRRYYTPAMIANISETDKLRTYTSKKAADIRAAEICSAVSADLLSWVARDGAEISRETGGSLVITEIMLEAQGATDKKSAMEALLVPLAAPYPSSDASHPIDLPHTSRLYKALLQGGHFSQLTQSVVLRPNFSPSAFATAFLHHVGSTNICAMACGGGAFVVAALLNRVATDGSQEECDMLNQCMTGLKGIQHTAKGWGAVTESMRLLEARMLRAQ